MYYEEDEEEDSIDAILAKKWREHFLTIVKDLLQSVARLNSLLIII